MKILVVNGPNWDLSDKRTLDYYGKQTLEDLQAEMQDMAEYEGVEIEVFQSSIEGEIVNAINFSDADGIVLNAGSYTHYSIAIRDAVSASGIPTVEVHMSNLFDREDFRNHSVISAAACGVVAGFGVNSYRLAVSALLAQNA